MDYDRTYKQTVFQLRSFVKINNSKMLPSSADMSYLLAM